MNTILAGLNKEYSEAVTHKEGSLLTVTGGGTAKVKEQFK